MGSQKKGLSSSKKLEDWMIKLKFFITIMIYNESLFLFILSFTGILAISIDLTFQKLHKNKMEI